MDSQSTSKGGEHYNLRWTNYLSNLSQIVLEHHINERLVDVTLVCEGQYIKAHKLVLSACSIFFQDMFKINTNVPQLVGNFIHPFIVMNGVCFSHLKHIIDFMYQGEIKVLDSDLEGVLALGENLQVKGLCSVKLKQKVGINNEVKHAEQLVPPFSPKTPPPRKPTQVEPRMNVESQKIVIPPLKSYSKLPSLNNPTPPMPVEADLALNKSQEEPRNYSKVTLDALSQGNTTINLNNRVNDNKQEEKMFSTPTVINQTIQIEEDLEEPAYKKIKVNHPPLVIRSSDVMKAKHTKATTLVVKSKQVTLNNSAPQSPVDGDKDKKSEIPKPPNAFMIFANEWRKKLAVEHPDESSKDISIRLGNLWKTLTYETKVNYYHAARTALKEHELKYPQTVPKPDPQKKKIFVKPIKKLQNSSPPHDIVDLQGDNDDLEIIDSHSPATVESNSQDSSTSTSLST